MAAPLVHSVIIEADASKIYEAISTGKGLASFWTRDSQAQPKVGSIAQFGFGGPRLDMKVEELDPGRLVRWSSHGGFPERVGTKAVWEIGQAAEGGNEGKF